MSLPQRLYDMYDDMLDDCYTDIDVFGVSRSPSVVFKRVDSLMYEMGLVEYLDSLEEDNLFCWTCERLGEKDCYCEEEEE